MSASPSSLMEAWLGHGFSTRKLMIELCFNQSLLSRRKPPALPESHTQSHASARKYRYVHSGTTGLCHAVRRAISKSCSAMSAQAGTAISNRIKKAKKTNSGITKYRTAKVSTRDIESLPWVMRGSGFWPRARLVVGRLRCPLVLYRGRFRVWRNRTTWRVYFVERQPLAGGAGAESNVCRVNASTPICARDK